MGKHTKRNVPLSRSQHFLPIPVPLLPQFVLFRCRFDVFLRVAEQIFESH